MDYSILADVYEKLENTPAKHGKRDILAQLLKEADPKELGQIVLLAAGQVFPVSDSEELGIAESMMKKAISKATGHSEAKITDEFKKTGDLGLVAEGLVGLRKQSTLMSKKLTTERVIKSLRELPNVTGSGSQDRKLNILAELVSTAKPKEAKYITRTALGTLRIGVAEGVIRDAIAMAFDVKPDSVERAWNLMPDFGEVARIARTKGEAGLARVTLKLGVSAQVLLAEKAPDLKTALDQFERPDIEVKYDGARVQIHKDGENVVVFTRRLEDVTRQFPDLVRMTKESVKVKSCILDGEMLAVDRKTGRPLPFQQLSQRIQRKYDIERMVKEIPIQVNIFDVLYANGEPLLDLTLIDRIAELKKIIVEVPGKFQLAKGIMTKDYDDAKKFYDQSLADSQEGVMVKNLDSKYVPGRRVGYWLKVKPEMEPLDLVITGAEWGTGKRASWLSSYVLSVLDEKTGKFLQCGMMGTGLTDEQFEEMTNRLKGLVTEESGRSVRIRPQVVLEIGYQEIQRSPKYESGFALRFPKLLRDRSADKGPQQADTVKRLQKLYESQLKKTVA
jgi:DNA ligase 1